MKNSWRQFFRRLAAGCVLSGAMAWSSAMCFAVQLAFDSADDPVYADGWEAGQNGGFGFTPWNFDSTIYWEGTLYYYDKPGFHEIDDGLQNGTQFSNPFNDIGRAWTIGLPENFDGTARAGRGFAALQPGQTFSIVVDNPTASPFGKGFFIRLNGNTGGFDGSICYGGHPCKLGTSPVPQLNLRVFENFTDGLWQIADFGFSDTTLFDVDSAEGGMRLDVTLTGADSYDLVMTPLGNPDAAFMHSGTFATPGASVDWLEITFFTNVISDTAEPPQFPTDFYISSIEITGDAPPGVLGDYNEDGTIDAADYTVWRDNLGGPGTALANRDPNNTGAVGQADYDVWKANFGQTASGGAPLGIGAAVPEPGTFVYLVAAMFGLVPCALRVRPRRSAADPSAARTLRPVW